MADKQGPWTRIRPLQKDELDPYTKAGVLYAESTWGGFPTNLLKVMAYLPRLTQTEAEYANTFIFDPPTFRGDVLEAGFNDRPTKELIISRVSLANRSRYSIEHHALLGMLAWIEADRAEDGHQKFLHLHEHEQHSDVYTERERVILDYAVAVAKDAHLVDEAQFDELRRVLREHNTSGTDSYLKDYLAGLDEAGMSRHVEAQINEITWLIGQFCLLNRWFTVLQVPAETADDEADFTPFYEEVVPADVRQRNADLLGDDF